MASKFKEITDKELVEELSRRFDHVCIELVRDLEDGAHLCRESYKGEFSEEWVEVEEGGA